MKIILLTGSHPRHLFLAQSLYQEGLLGGLLIETRGSFVPAPDARLSDRDRAHFIRHFKDREESEEKAFGKIDADNFSGIPLLEATKEELNSPEIRSWISSIQPDVAISYGVHKLGDELLSILPSYAWNIHGGLSPWYRGNATLFWPFYFLKPNWAGMTIHQLTAKLDGGGIIHHSVPILERGDGIHDVACNAVKQAGEDLIRLLSMIRGGQPINAVSQKSSGKLFTTADWLPQHLRLIYETFNNDIVDRYLDGEFGHHEPPLIKAF
jgi:folate-dependent phosphoribosylglycinamide formyltransferase PurN